MARELTKTEKGVLGFFGVMAAIFGIRTLTKGEEIPPPPPPPPPPPGMAILYGWLHNVRNEPIINTATHVNGYSGETDQAGRFYISLDPGTYYTLTADGHEPYTFLNPVVLEADTEVCVKYIFLKPIGFEEGKIHGLVRDSNTGQAVAGAHVEAYGQPRGIAGQWAGEAMTNSLGYYEIDWAAGMPSDFLGLEYCHLHVHHPQYHDLETQRFDLMRGESIEINLDLVYKGGLPAAPYIYSMSYSTGSGWRELWNVIEGQKEIPAVALGVASYISVWFYCKGGTKVRSTITRPDGTQKVSETTNYPPGGAPDTGEWDYRADGSGGISPLDQLGTYTAKYELLGDLIQGEREVLYTVELTLLSVVEPKPPVAFELYNFSVTEVLDTKKMVSCGFEVTIKNVDTVSGSNTVTCTMISPTGAMKSWSRSFTLSPGQIWNWGISLYIRVGSDWPDDEPVTGRYTILMDGLTKYMDVV